MGMTGPMSRSVRHAKGQPSEIISRNVRALKQVRSVYERDRSREQRVADAITRFAGSMLSVYLHGALVVLWLVLNAGVFGDALVFDPYPFVMLAMFASVEAIFLSSFVLISQNRQTELSAKRDDLELHTNLLAEHEITKLIGLVDEIAQRLGVPRGTAETDGLKEEVDPSRVLEDIERAEREGP